MASDAGAICRGLWHPKQSSQSFSVRLAEREGRLVVLSDDGDVLVAGDFQSLNISPRVGSIARRIVFSDGSLFETSDNDAVDGLLRDKGRRHAGFIHGLERFHPRLLLFALAVFFLSGAVYRYALPALVEVAVLVTPPVVPQLMSASTLQTMDRTVLDKSALGEDVRSKIAADFARIAAASSRGVDGYDLQFRKGGAIGPNAFALPDGTLILTDELVEMADGDTEMVVGVLAHEIGHVELEHSLRQLYRAAGVAGLIMLIAGDVGDAAENILTQGAGLAALSYSRSAESEADRRSVELMKRAGLEPTAIGRFFAVLEKKLGDGGGTSILSTHPGTLERRKAIDDYARLLH